MPELQQEIQRSKSRGSNVGSASTRSQHALNKENEHMDTSRRRIGSAKYYDIAAALMGKGQTADLEELFIKAARDGEYDKIEAFLLRSGKDYIVDIDIKDKHTGNTPLIWATKRGHLKIVNLLLNHGADVTLKNYEEKSAVELASPGIRKVLLESVEKPAESWHQSLLQAAWQGNIRVVRKLMNDSRIKDVDCKNAEGLTPLLLVTRDVAMFENMSTQQNWSYNPAEVVLELLSHRADIHAVDKDGKTALHYAAQCKTSIAQTIVQALITGGPSIEYQDHRHNAAIHVASQTGCDKNIEALIRGGACVNCQGYNGSTPLHFTAWNDHVKAACCLLKHGADVTIKDDLGKTAMDVAQSRRMKTTLKEAWTEATRKRPQANLGPLRQSGSKEDLRTSVEDLRKRKKSGGEVIFDNMPVNPFGSSHNTRGRPLTRNKPLNDKDKADIAEETMIKDMENGTFTPSPYYKDGIRRMGISRQSTQCSGLLRKLPSISPDRLTADRNTPSPFHRNTRTRRSLDESHMLSARSHEGGFGSTFPASGCNRRYSPLSSVGSSHRLTPVTDDHELNHTHRNNPSSQGIRNSVHRRAGSDSMACPSATDIAVLCEPYLPKRGRSLSTSFKILSKSDEYCSETNFSSPRVSSEKTSLERDIVLQTPYSVEDHDDVSDIVFAKEDIDLDRMGILGKNQKPIQTSQLFPTSSKILPPSSMQSNFSDKDDSPRSEDESERMKFIPMSFENSTLGLQRNRTIYKEEFILEESRPKDPMTHLPGSDCSSCGSKDRSSVSSEEMAIPMDVDLPTNDASSTIASKKRKVQTTCKNETKKNVPRSQQYSVISVNEQSKVKSNLRTTGKRFTSDSPTRASSRMTVADSEKDAGSSIALNPGVSPMFPIERDQGGTPTSCKPFSVLTVKKDKTKSQRFSPQSQADSVFDHDAPMQVVPSKLVSNLKEEVEKTKHNGKNIQPNNQNQATKGKIVLKQPQNNTVTNRNNTGTSNIAANNSHKNDTNTAAVKTTTQPSQKKDKPQENIVQSKQWAQKSQTVLKNQKGQSNETNAVSKSMSNVLKTSKNGMVNTRQNSNLKTVSQSTAESLIQKNTGMKKSASDSAVVSKDGKKPVTNNKARSTSIERDKNKEHATNCLKSNSSSSQDTPKERGTPLKSLSDSNVSKEDTTISPSSTGQSTLTPYKSKGGGITPLVEISPTGAPRAKPFVPTPVQPVQTPIIVNPFEEFETNNMQKPSSKGISATAYGYVVGKPTTGLEKSKTTLSSKNSNRCKSAKKKDSKPSSANQSNKGRRQGAKSKDSKGSDDSRPKSGKNKRVRSGKKKKKEAESLLSKQAAQPNVAIITGKNWHLTTQCLDTSDVKAVQLNASDSSSEEEDSEYRNNVNKNYKTYHPDQHPSYQYQNHLYHTQDYRQQDYHHLHHHFHNSPNSNQSTPRFHEVKPDGTVDKKALPVMTNDGYPPMNLDMTQPSTAQNSLGLSQMLQREKTNENMSPSAKDMVRRFVNHEMPYDLCTNEELSEEQAEILNTIHRDLVLGVLTPIPESPSLRSNPKLNKTIEALKKFDKDVPEEELNHLLGLESQRQDSQAVVSNRSVPPHQQPEMSKSHADANVSKSSSNIRTKPINKNTSSLQSSQEFSQKCDTGVVPKSGVRNSSEFVQSKGKNSSGVERKRSSSQERKIPITNSSPSAPNSGQRMVKPRSSTNDRKSGNMERDVNVASSTKIASGRDRGSSTFSREPSGNKTSGGNSAKTTNFSALSRGNSSVQPITSSAKIDKIDRDLNLASAGTKTDVLPSEDVQKINSAHVVPKLDYKWNEHDEDSDSTGKSFEGVTARRERQFSESRYDDEEVKEAIEEILSNTLSSNASTLKANSLNRKKSLSSTFSEADTHVLKKLEAGKKKSPFYSSSAQEAVRQSASVEDLTAQHPTNPHLMKVFHAENFEIGRKMKAMIDADADKGKVRAMLDLDKESQGLAKVINSFKQMKLYAGGGSSIRASGEKLVPHPEACSMEPASSKKPPVTSVRPSSAGPGSKMRSAGRFHEIKENQLSQSAVERTPRRSGLSLQKDKVSVSRQSIEPSHDNSIPGDAAELQLLNIASAQGDDEDDEFFHGPPEDPSRSGSACTTNSSISNSEEPIVWKKGNVLGKGAFGVVWCGLTNEGQLIAVKQIELNTIDKDKAKREYEKVQEEVELLKTLNHKHIVSYFGTSLEDNVVSIFMQFVPGGSIASILARFGALDESVFRRYTKQILEGVQYLHSNDVIHRDIKGGNVMLMPTGVIKLIDFGCAKRLCINLSMGQSQILKSMKGTPYWMAPEVVNETGHGKKSDIWSVGCTVFEMATRKPPWAEMNPMAAIFAIGSNTKPIPQLPEKFSAEAVAFVNACLTRDQNSRLSASQLLQHGFITRRKGSRRPSNS